MATLSKLASALGRRLDLRFLEYPAAPSRGESPAPAPRRLRRLFWDRALRPSDLDRHPTWVVQRVLELGQLDDVLGLVRYYGREEFLEIVAGARFESPRTRAFWEAVLSVEGRSCTTRFSRTEADACWMP